MSRDDGLCSYREMASINRALKGISRRLRCDNPLKNSIVNLEENYAFLALDFEQFLPELCRFVEQQRNALNISGTK